MRLTAFTDFGLRALMRLAGEPDRSFTTDEIASEFAISRHHLVKVVRRLAEAGYVLSMVMNGHRGMPPFRGHFTNAQVADVVNFVRSHFGNHYKGKVTEAEVQALR
jgi:DNA-binding IscR family transcriptional regulator